MENKLYRLVFLTAIIFFAVGVQAQRRNARYVEYIISIVTWLWSR